MNIKEPENYQDSATLSSEPKRPKGPKPESVLLTGDAIAEEQLEQVCLSSSESPDDGLAMISSGSKPKIVTREHAPEWMIDNKFLLRGYRVNFQKKRDLLKSLFMRHNELLNIWTHLIGGLVFVAFIIYMAFYFDLFNYLRSKLKDMFDSHHIQVMKNAVPSLTEIIK